MDAPSDDEEWQEYPVPIPLSAPPLDFRGPPYPPYNYYNAPGPLPPSPFDASYTLRTPAAAFPAIRPFRQYNYLDSRGEDLTSRVYTLGADNLWEFTTYESAAHWNPHQVWRESGGGNASQPQVQPGIAMTHTHREHTPPRYPQPPSPNTVRPRARTPVTPPVAGPSTGPGTTRAQQRRRRGSVQSDERESIRWCDSCDKGFFRKAEYDRHIKTTNVHRSSNPEHQCGKCGAFFTRADARVRHERLCDGTRHRKRGSKDKGKERAHSDEY